MIPWSGWARLAALAWLAGAPLPGALAQTDSADDAGALGASESPWRAEVGLWAWIMGIDGDLGVRGQTASVSGSFIDLLETSDSIFALSGRIEVGHGPLAGYLDGLYADLGADNQTGPGGGEVDVEFEQEILDFGLMYRLGTWAPSGPAGDNPRLTTLDVYGGGRYSGLEMTLRPAGAPSVSGSEDWVDPVVGAKMVIPLAERWHLSINGDVGGFGVESDLTWSATGLLGYDFYLWGNPASALAGYRAIGWDYSSGAAGDEFTWDVVQHGLILGLSVQF